MFFSAQSVLSKSYILSPYERGSKPTTYRNVSVGSQHVYAQPYTPQTTQALAEPSRDEYVAWFYDEWRLEAAIDHIMQTLRIAPAATDFAFGVADDGYTETKAVLCRSTEWVPVTPVRAGHRRVYARFSEARTAAHRHPSSLHVLRTPIAGGAALEVATKPYSDDPRDMMTVLIFEHRQTDRNRPHWIMPHGPQVFSLAEFQQAPHPADAFHDGYPNQITASPVIAEIIAVVRELISETLKL